jgi:palmitoyl-protein thioesterase
VDEFARVVRSDPRLAKGFNLIGHSQGGLISRAYIERYNDPPVHNFITWATPHGGQYGVPELGPMPEVHFTSAAR